MKPIHEAHILKDACLNCKVETHYATHLFYCQEQDLGVYGEPCSIEDWDSCPFNEKIKLHPQGQNN